SLRGLFPVFSDGRGLVTKRDLHRAGRLLEFRGLPNAGRADRADRERGFLCYRHGTVEAAFKFRRLFPRLIESFFLLSLVRDDLNAQRRGFTYGHRRSSPVVSCRRVRRRRRRRWLSSANLGLANSRAWCLDR